MKEDNRQDLIDLVRTGQLSGRIIVLEGEPLINVLNQDYHSPYYYIGMCRRGESRGCYNYKPCSQHAGEICWLQPDHVISHSYISPDYEAISVFIPKDYLEQLMQAGVLGKYQYLLYTPILKLSPEQFATMYAGLKFLQQLTDCPDIKRDELVATLIRIIATLGDELIRIHHPNISKRKMLQEQLFERFYEAITTHYREAREVAFYANLLCLTPKYFASVIKQTTGIAASEWISRHVIIKAKYLLSNDTNKSIQQISYELGFSEPTTFSRYFRTHVGITPKKYREQHHY